MKRSDLVRKLIRDFLLIFATIIMIITFLRQIYDPQTVFDLKSIYIIMAFSFISSLVGFILYSPNDISEQIMRLRRAIHFLTLEVLLIALASIFDIVNSGVEAIILAVQIAAIYIIVRLLSWHHDKKETNKINEKLKSFKKEV
ncbi:DUF3021 family protein [Pseudoneobacillus sp. C159]